MLSDLGAFGFICGFTDLSPPVTLTVCVGGWEREGSEGMRGLPIECE